MTKEEKNDEVKTKDPKPLVEAIEEDDDFEEFASEQWGKDQTENVSQQWMDNWDDNMDDEFTKNLREELIKTSEKSNA